MNEIGQDLQTARELTEEIDRATDGAVAEMAQNEVRNFQNARMNRGMREVQDMQGSRDAQMGRGMRENQDIQDAQDVRALQGLGRETAGGLGGKILAYGGTEQQRENERVYEMAEIDNGYGREMMSGVSQVGEESGRQIAEREAWDAENRRNEDNPKRDDEARIMARDQGGIARETAEQIEIQTRQRTFTVSDIEKTWLRASAAMREAYENPYKLGERN